MHVPGLGTTASAAGRRLSLTALLILSVGCEESSRPFVGESRVNGFATTLSDNRLMLESVTIDYEGDLRTLRPAELKNIELLDYTSSELPFETTILGFPQPTGTPEDTAPTNDTRALLIEDFAINTVLENPGIAAGLTFQFVDGSGNRTSVSNGAGPDILILEIGPTIGTTVPGPPPTGTTMSQGGDPFTLRGTGSDVTRTRNFAPEDYAQLGDSGIAAAISLFSNVAPMDPADPIASLTELEETPLQFVTTTDLNVYALLVDLSDLGYEPGAAVSEMQILSLGEEFGVDLALIVGLQ